MESIHDIMRERLLLRAGVVKPAQVQTYSMKEMEALQWGEEWHTFFSL